MCRVLLVLFVVSLLGSLVRLWEAKRGGEEQREAEQISGLAEEKMGREELRTEVEGEIEGPSGPRIVERSENEAVSAGPAETAAPPGAVDLDALRAVNGEVIGWISIPDTKLSYPLLQGTDDQYYLKHSWKKTSSAAGAIFLEHGASPSLADRHTIVYGHRMVDGTMFGSLQGYREADYWKVHPSIYIVTESGTLQYDIYAAYELSVDSVVYEMEEAGPECWDRLLELGRENAYEGAEELLAEAEHILTLSTCTGHGYSHRWVVQAALVGLQAQETQASRK